MPVVPMVRMADIREMQFPDTWVIIPCSVRLTNWEFAVLTCVYSAP